MLAQMAYERPHTQTHAHILTLHVQEQNKKKENLKGGTVLCRGEPKGDRKLGGKDGCLKWEVEMGILTGMQR